MGNGKKPNEIARGEAIKSTIKRLKCMMIILKCGPNWSIIAESWYLMGLKRPYYRYSDAIRTCIRIHTLKRDLPKEILFCSPWGQIDAIIPDCNISSNGRLNTTPNVN